MYSQIKSASYWGLKGYIVNIETLIARGLPRFTIVGLPDKTIGESKERVISAIKSSGFTFPLKRITVNLSPPNIPKHGTGFDLPIALSILIASNQLSKRQNENTQSSIIFGELSLSGKVKPIKGLPILVQIASKNKIPVIITPDQDLLHSYDKNQIMRTSSLNDCLHILNGQKRQNPQSNSSSCRNRPSTIAHPFLSIKGNTSAKRAALIAAAGRHHLSISGPTGCGKTLIAETIINLLPSMTIQEKIEVETIYSISNEPRPRQRPLRSPHHTTGLSSIIGGGSGMTPGELSLSHNGVLFLDELPEFSSKVINSLRTPLEKHRMKLIRNNLSVIFPTNFLLVAAMNPCRCGNFGSKDQKCTCSPFQVSRYQSKIPQPIWDRIDMNISMTQDRLTKLLDQSEDNLNQYSNKLKECWDLQQKRGIFNNQIQFKDIKNLPLGNSERELLSNLQQKLRLSTRGIEKIIRVARTIADLELSKRINENHISEAASYRKITSA